VRTWLPIVGYLLGAVITGRITALRFLRDGDPREDAAFMAVVFAVMWPFVAAVVAILAPLFLVGWLLTHPTRSQRREQDAERVAALAKRYDLPNPSETP
jgi:hypothetical protein